MVMSSRRAPVFLCVLLSWVGASETTERAAAPTWDVRITVAEEYVSGFPAIVNVRVRNLDDRTHSLRLFDLAWAGGFGECEVQLFQNGKLVHRIRRPVPGWVWPVEEAYRFDPSSFVRLKGGESLDLWFDLVSGLSLERDGETVSLGELPEGTWDLTLDLGFAGEVEFSEEPSITIRPPTNEEANLLRRLRETAGTAKWFPRILFTVGDDLSKTANDLPKGTEDLMLVLGEIRACVVDEARAPAGMPSHVFSEKLYDQLMRVALVDCNVEKKVNTIQTTSAEDSLRRLIELDGGPVHSLRTRYKIEYSASAQNP